MGNIVGVGVRILSAITFLLGILVCIFSFRTGIIMILLGGAGWNIGAKLLDFSEEKFEMDEKEIEQPVKTISYQNIDYSAIPYDLSAGLENADNRFQALTDISYMNGFLKEACRLGNIKSKLEICTEEVLWEGETPSTLTKIPHTKTGKVPKYIVDLFFTTRDSSEFEPIDDYFGNIYYMQDGSIGKAWLVCWIKKKTYCIHIGLVGTSLVIKKIETHSKTGEKEVIYKM